MAQRDNLFDLAALPFERFSISGIGTEHYSTPVSLAHAAGIMFAVEIAIKLGPPDRIFSYRFQTSNDGFATFDEVPAEAMLPRWYKPTTDGYLLAKPVSPYVQTMGFIGNGLSCRMVFTVIKSANTLNIWPIILRASTPFTGWSDNIIPGDAQP